MFTDSIRPEALALLKRLMTESRLEEDFRLVGGTGLALLQGHRLSVDLDLFSFGRQLPANLETLLEQKYQLQSVALGDDRAVLSGFIDQVKVDFVAYPYPWLVAAQVVDGIRIADLPDIAAMKVSAIGQRGSRKDFFDLAELLNHFSLEQIMDFFRRKFPAAADLHYLQALTYFDDAERDPDPVATLRTLSWSVVKANIVAAVRLLSQGPSPL